MICPRCMGTEWVRSGSRRGVARQRCKGCGGDFLERVSHRRLLAETKKLIANLIDAGVDISVLARAAGVDYGRIYRMKKRAGSAESE